MGWQSFVGSFKIQVSFATAPHKRDLEFLKETYIFGESTNRKREREGGREGGREGERERARERERESEVF